MEGVTMSLRLIEINIPPNRKVELLEVLSEFNDDLFIYEGVSEKQLLAKLTLPAEKTEAVMDALEKQFGEDKHFRLTLLAIEASLPRPKTEPLKEVPQSHERVAIRVGREELYNDIIDATRLDKIYIVMVILSSIVASIGLVRENITAIIGAMVIAPLLGPNVALALATTLGDTALGIKAIKVNVSGVAVALMLAILFGWFLQVDASNEEIMFRTTVHLSDVALALASGCAGALAFTTGVPAVLVGVMVAVALLPPLITFGLMLGAGHAAPAAGAALLLLTNVICVNLAGVVTFLLQGIRPVSWWEADKAKKATTKAIFAWSLLLIALSLIIVMIQS